VEVTFRYAPRPLSEDEEALEENLVFLREWNRGALERLGWGR